MQGEQTTLWTFGGGIDPSLSDLEEKEKVHVRKKLVVTGGDRTITDLGIRLEQDLIEQLDPGLLATGEKRRQLRMQPQQADWIGAMYIRAEPTDETRTFDQAVMQSDGYPTVGIPRALLRNDVVNGIDNPFHDAGPDDYVVVRYLPEEGIEIYPEEVFKAHPEFTQVRATVPLAVSSPADAGEDGCYNLAKFTPYDGQMFEIVPFRWNRYQDTTGKEMGTSTEDVFTGRKFGPSKPRPTPEEFTRLLPGGGIQPCSTSYLNICWDPEFIASEEVAPDQSEKTVRLTLRETERVQVILPAYGIVHIYGSGVDLRELPTLVHRSYEHRITDVPEEDRDYRFSDENGITRLNRKHIRRMNDRWWGRFFEIPEDGPPIIYIPEKHDTFYI